MQQVVRYETAPDSCDLVYVSVLFVCLSIIYAVISGVSTSGRVVLDYTRYKVRRHVHLGTSSLEPSLAGAPP